MEIPSAVSNDYIETALSRIPERPRPKAEQQVIECLKYLCIMSLTRGRRIAVTPEVDDIWHELIVQTQTYRTLCKQLPGERFVHHESITPRQYEERVGNDEFVDEFLKWIPDYVQSFGPFTEASGEHWTIVQFLQKNLGMTLSEINDLGASEEAEAALPMDSPWRKLGNARKVADLNIE